MGIPGHPQPPQKCHRIITAGQACLWDLLFQDFIDVLCRNVHAIPVFPSASTNNQRQHKNTVFPSQCWRNISTGIRNHCDLFHGSSFLHLLHSPSLPWRAYKRIVPASGAFGNQDFRISSNFSLPCGRCCVPLKFPSFSADRNPSATLDFIVVPWYNGCNEAPYSPGGRRPPGNPNE